MEVIRVRNVHQALPLALEKLKFSHVVRPSRNGDVMTLDVPVVTQYERPMERVMFWPERDGNPFFHLFEALWMLAGRRDLAPITEYVKQMAEYSDDGETIHGAYGYRWRKHFDVDQILIICERLRKDPDDRRSVLTMWDPSSDLGITSRDLPCNTHVYFAVSANKQLDMTVCNRSNDILWGAYGANAVHMSMLMEVVAHGAQVDMGRYYQFSNNWHIYVDKYAQVESLSINAADPYRRMTPDPYFNGEVRPYPVIRTPVSKWLDECERFVNGANGASLQDSFWGDVAEPMRYAHETHKKGRTDQAIAILREQCKATDWRRAGIEWLERRLSRAGSIERDVEAADARP